MSTVKSAPLPANQSILELTGACAWVRTCAEPECECRTAFIVVTEAGRKAVIEQGAAMTRAQTAGATLSQAAAGLAPHAEHFYIDIDEPTAAQAGDYGMHRDVSDRPLVARVLSQLNGERLEEIGRQWYRGKGKPLPEEEALEPGNVELPGWEPGKLVSWETLNLSTREDWYSQGGSDYRGFESYCPIPGCDCAHVVVRFADVHDRNLPGQVDVDVSSEEVEIHPGRKGGKLLEQLWSAFKARHPDPIGHFKRRYALVRKVGEILDLKDASELRSGPQLREARPAAAAATPIVRAAPKVGRNDPCPCGSGRKYKKCCGAAA